MFSRNLGSDMIYEILDLVTEAKINILVVINTLLIVGSLMTMRQLVQLIDPPVAFVMTWGKLSQHIPKGNPNFVVDFMPGSAGKKKAAVRIPTCQTRFNGIHFTPRITGGFFS